MTGWLDTVGHVLRPLPHVDPRWALLALALQLANLACRALTWRNVLAGAYPDLDLPVRRIGLAYAVGCALNGFLPARGGEAVKVALVRLQLPATSTASVASSCTVVMVFDVLVACSILTVGWLTHAVPSPPGIVTAAAQVATDPRIALLALALVGAVAWLGARRAGPRMRSVAGELRTGLAVLRTPGRYVRSVVSVQALAWCCRIGVVACMLHAFGITASLPLAALVVVVGGMSTMVPVPGGAGSQQALAVFVLASVATSSSAFSYSVAMQLGVTLVNTAIGLVAAMLIFGRLHPGAALRAAWAARHHTHEHDVELPVAPVPALPAVGLAS